MKKPDMNAENAFVLLEAAKAADAGYSDHLAYGGKGDPAEERWIEALNAGAAALTYTQQLEAELAAVKRERDAAISDLAKARNCNLCKHDAVYTSVCDECKHGSNFAWRGVPEV